MTLAAVAAAPVEPGGGAGAASQARTRWRDEHSILWLLAQRSAIGIVTLFLVSVVVSPATQTLPGSVAKVILGQTATPARVPRLTLQLHLNEGAFAQYWQWISGVLSGRLGESFANREPVWQVVSPRLLNSASARRARRVHRHRTRRRPRCPRSVAQGQDLRSRVLDHRVGCNGNA